MFIYFWEREGARQSMTGGGAEREGDTEYKAVSRLWAVSTEPDMGPEPTNHEIMTWAKVRCLTDWATQASRHYENSTLCYTHKKKIEIDHKPKSKRQRHNF